MFKFSGRRPRDLGVRDGRFTAAATWKPNWVSSQVDAADAQHGCEELPAGLGAGPCRGEFEKSVDAGGIEPVVPGDLVQLSSRRLSLHWRRSIRACRRTPAI